MTSSETPRKGRILIADDDRTTSQLIGTYLESRGYEVIRAWNGREALGAVQANEPDLLILDVVMPGMTGLELAAVLRDQANTAALPIIMLSSRGEVSDKVQGLTAGADEYVLKPVALQELGARVEAMLRRARLSQPAQSNRCGKVVAFMGVKGGVGTTTVVLNTAAALVQQKKTVLALELHPSYGTFSHQLKFAPAESLASLLSLEVDHINERELRSRLFGATSGLAVLPGPQRIGEFGDLPAACAEAIVRQATLLADFVLIDLPSQPSDASRAVAGSCDLVILVLEPDLACISCAKIALELVKTWGINAGIVGLAIVIQGKSSSTLSPNNIRSQLGCEIVGIVTAAAEALVAAQEHAMPLVLYLPAHQATSSFIEIAKRLAAPTLIGIRL